jgi:uncharacterized lipoprotein YbaY
MKLLFGLLGLFLLSTSIVREEKVSFEIKGNPKCLVRNERYELKADLKSSDKDEFIFLAASGVSLTKKMQDGQCLFLLRKKQKQ